MKKSLLVITALGISIAATALESNAVQDPGPEILKLKIGTSFMSFQHRRHQNLQHSECFHCHLPNKWIIDNWGKEVAHSMCISCHDLNDTGPVKCGECHKVDSDAK